MRSRPIILNIMLFLAFSMLVQHSSSAQLHLLKRAHPVLGGKFDISDDTHSFAMHFWQSSSSVIVIYKDNNSLVQVRHLDTRTGHASYLKGLGPGLEGQKVEYHGTLLPETLSPDGQWLLGMRDPLGEGCTYEAVGVNNRQRKVWRSSEYPTSDYGTVDIHWLPDSQHWFYWEDSGQMILYSLSNKHPRSWRVTTLPTPEKGKGWEKSVGWVMGLNAKHEVILMSGNFMHTYGQTAQVYRLTPTPNPKAVPVAQFHLPRTLLPTDVVLSPDGQRLAWLCESYKQPNAVSWSVWVSDLDGRHLHEIGHTPYYNEPPNISLYDMKWKPGGKEISFIFQDRLWTMAIDGK